MNEKINHISEWLGTGSLNVFGRPFAGKDTQCDKLVNLLDGVLIGSGEILRSYHDQGQLDQIMATGQLIPSDLYEKIILPFFSRPEINDKSLILSSVGRMSGEEEVVMSACAKSGHPIKAAILLQLSEDEVWQRFEAAKTIKDRGDRPDDDSQVLKTRLSVFQKQTMPVIESYREKGLLVEIDGALSREEVTTHILNSLLKLI